MLTLHCHVMLTREEGAWLSLTLFPSQSHWLGMFCEILCLPTSSCIAMTRLCRVQKLGGSWEHSAPSVGGHANNLSMPPFSQLGKAGSWGTVDPGFSSLGVGVHLKYVSRRAQLEGLRAGGAGVSPGHGFLFQLQGLAVVI